jgi:hypothetical protein
MEMKAQIEAAIKAKVDSILFFAGKYQNHYT